MARKGTGVEVHGNSIRLRFTYEGEPHKHTLRLEGGQPMAPTAANLKYAERLAQQIREKIRHGTFVLVDYFPASAGQATTGLTLATQLDSYLAAQRLEASSLKAYRSAAAFWKAAALPDQAPLGDRPLRALKKSEIMTAIAQRPDLNGKTVNNYVSVLRQALDLAVDDGMLSTNPATTVPRARWQRDDPDPFSLDEAEKIIAYAAKHYPPEVANLIEWWFFVGVRPSEMSGLRWSSVDLPGEHFVVHEVIVRGIKKDKTKTAVSRKVRLNSRAMAALTRQAKHTRLSGEHVWLDPRYGTPWLEERAFRRSYWTPALKALGIRYRPPKQMRHTYATMMLMAGRRPAWCAGQLGHSVEMFLRTYSRWIEGAHDDLEMDALEHWLQQSRSVRRDAG